jgi:cytochrome P450
MASGLLAYVLPQSVGGIILLVFTVLVAYQSYIYFYNIFLHPLREFPGPRNAAASCVPSIRQALRGDIDFWITGLHLQYGEVVRVSPNELSFSSADAWKDIYGHKRAGKPSLVKDPAFYVFEDDRTIINADDESHARQRRIFANAFSDRALKMQEPLFLTYVNKLVEKLRTKSASNPDEEFNMVNMSV